MSKLVCASGRPSTRHGWLGSGWKKNVTTSVSDDVVSDGSVSELDMDMLPATSIKSITGITGIP